MSEQQTLPIGQFDSAPDPDQTARILAATEQHPLTEYEDHTSEAAKDQGWGPAEAGFPLEDEDHPRRKPEAIAAERAAKQRRLRRIGHRENRYSDIATPPLDGPVLPATDPAIVARGVLAAKRAMAPRFAQRIADDAGNDPKLAQVLARARTEERDTP